jgi:DNA end-binding protein Ku
MPPRSSWKGFIRLSLISVPVKAFTATSSSSEIRLNQLHKECHSPIKYQKRCPVHGDISNDEIVSGYQYAKGQFVEIDPDELGKLRSASDKSISVEGFIAPTEVDAVYFKGKNHYLVPDGPVGQKPYALLRAVMVEKGLFALAQVVLAGREQLVLLRPLDRLLVMSGINYENEVKPASAFEDELVSTEFSKEELKLASTLIEASVLEDFDFSKYQDSYTETLTKLIEAKVEGKEIVVSPVTEEAQVINLMDALKQSVNAALGKGKGAAAAAAKSGRKMAPSARKTTKKAKKKKSG